MGFPTKRYIAVLFLLAFPLRAQDVFKFIVPPTSPYTVVYSSNPSTDSNAVTFNVQAQTGGVKDPSFNSSAVVGLFDTSTGLPSDSQAILVDASGNTHAAGSPLTFVSGSLNFGITFMAGSNSEQVSIFDVSADVSGDYPGGSVPGAGYTVTGYSTIYYLKEVNQTNIPVTYLPPPSSPATFDTLIPNNPDAWMSGDNEYVTIMGATSGASVTNSLCFAVTGVNGGFAAGNAGIFPTLNVFKSANMAQNPTVNYEVILDYDGSLTDYNNPRPAKDTVWGGSGTATRLYSTSTNPIALNGAVSLSGPNFKSYMQNGAVIVRVWWTDTVNDPAYLNYASTSGLNYLSSVAIPYSSNNIQPVQGAILGPPVALDGSTVTIQYAVTNLYSNPITQFAISIPPNNPVTGTSWVVNSVTSDPKNPGSMFIASQAGSAPGTVLFTDTSAPLTVNEAITFSMNVQCSNETNTAWQFPVTFATDTNGFSAPTQSTKAVIETLGVPSQSASFAGAAANYNSGGGAVSLSWAPVTDQYPTGYVLTRDLPGGLFGPVTLSDGTTYANAVTFSTANTTYTDSPVTNLTGYNYSLAAYNPVAHAPAAAFGPVTAFANPGLPTALAALTGGTTVQLNWTAPVSVSGSFPLAGYQVFRNGSAVATVTAPTVTYLDTSGLAGGNFYNYYVSAFDNVGPAGPVSTAHNGGPSTPDTGYPLGWPPVPANNVPMVIAAGPTTYLNLTWTTPTKNLNPINFYNVWRQTGVGPVSQVETGGSTLLYDDSAVSIGATYYYYVQAVDSLGVTSNNSVTVHGQEGPSQPQSFLVSPSAAAITLTWQTIPAGGDNAVSYVAFRTSSAGSTAIYQPAVPAAAAQTLIDTLANGLTPGVNYSYYVAGVDAVTVTGADSITLTTALLPSAPAGVTAYSANQVNGTVDWTAAAVTNLTGYNLYRNTSPVTTGGVTVASNIPVSQAGNPVTTYTDLTSLTPGTIYYYFLQAVNAGGGGALSTAGFETPPAAPNLTAVSSAAAITLSWTPSAGAVSYTVYENSAAPVSIGITNSASFAVTSGLSPGVNYSFQLTAEDYGAGIILGGASTMTAPITWGLVPQPVSITSLSVSLTGPGSTAVTVNWTPVTEADATGVSLLYNTGPTTAGALGVSLSAAATTGSFNLGPDYIYHFWALVLNPYGTSSSALPGATTLTYPYAVNLAPVSIAPDGISRILSWTPGTGGNITQFIVYREEIAPIASGWSPAVTLLGNVSLPVTLTEPIAPAATYADEVVALNATGSGPYSNPQTFSSLPAAPVSVTALSGLSTVSSAVSLSWADSYAASEGVTAYIVYRSPSNAATNTYVAAATVVYPGPFTYTDNSAAVTATGVYYYLIAAEVNGVQTELFTANAVSVRAYEEPGAPGFPAAVPSNNNVQLTWTAAVSTTYPIAGYNIYRSTSASVTTATLLNASPDPVTLYNDSTAVNLTTYYYWVAMVDTAGDLSAFSGPVSAEPLNAPSVPGNVSLADGDEAVQITWKASTAGTLPIGGYQVYRSANGGVTFGLITQLGPSATGYVDGVPPGTALSNGVTYEYFVVAVDDSGVTTVPDASFDSVTVNGTPSAADINPPSNLAATGGSSQVKLSWTDSFVPFGQPVTGYQVYRSVGNPTSFAPLTMLGSLASPITDLAVSNGTAYYYYFVAYCQAGTTSSNSVTVNATPARPPSIPVGLTGVDGSNSVTLSWTPNTPVDNVGVTQYVVYRNAAAAITVYNAAATVDTTVFNGTTYTYQVEAVNANGVTGGLSPLITDYPYTMSAPTLNSGGGVASLAMTFTSPITTTYPVVSNDLERVPLGGSSPVTTNPLTSPVTDSTVTQGQLYVYTIQAVDNKGHLSPLSNAVTDAACNPPAAPSTVVVEPGSGQILLDWPPVNTPVGSLPVSFYLLTGPNGTVTVQASQSWYLDLPENGAGLVTYTLVGVDETGEVTANHSVTYSGVIAGTQNAALYNPPTGLTATALTNTKVQLTWNQPNFGGRIVTSFNIYRGNSYGSYTKIGSVNNPVTMISAPTFTDTNVFANNTYFYVVTAVYSGTTESPYSNHALCVTSGGGNTPTVSVGQMAFNANLVKPLSGQTLGIFFVSPASGPVAIKVYTIAGTLVKTLTPPAATANAPENLTWDMTDRNGSVVASGVYFLEMDGPGGFHVIKKVAVVK